MMEGDDHDGREPGLSAPVFCRPGDVAPYPFSFDQRPGAFEATAGLGPIHAMGRQTIDGWRVTLMCGGIIVAELDSAGAMALAIDIATHAGVVSQAEVCER